MTNQLRFLVCQIYQTEVRTVLDRWAWENVDMHVLPQICHHPYKLSQSAGNLNRLENLKTSDVLLTGQCYSRKMEVFGDNKPDCSHCLEPCFALFTNQTTVDFLIRRGDYLLSPGWLENWETNLAQWGFDQATAVEFFGEFSRQLTLLDSGVFPSSQDKLGELGAYLGLPVFTIPVGLDLLDLRMTNLVDEWKRKRADLIADAMRTELNRNAAESAMAFDLVSRLTHTKSEEDVVPEVMDLFRMLLSPQTVTYGSVVHGWVDKTFGCDPNPDGCKELIEWVILKQEDYAWTSSGNGFFMRLKYEDETVGVIHLDHFQMPEYRQKYLNVALNIASICGMAVTIARTYQKLQDAEENTRRGMENSEILRMIMSEITATLGLADLLPRILTTFYRIIPYRILSIYLMHNGQMQFQAGSQSTAEGKIIPHEPRPEHMRLDPASMLPYPLVFPPSTRDPSDPGYASEEFIRGWMGVPLMAGDKCIGYMFIANQEGKVFNSFDLRLAQSFADQAVIAIENDRLFKEIQTVAVTDGLTGLYNRRYFMTKAEQEFTRAQRYKRSLSVVMLDIDFFKNVNDTYGHAEGDRVLVQVAEICRRSIRSVDTAGRYGGEEFILLLPETPVEKAGELAERLRREVAESPTPSETGEIRITISLGVAGWESGSRNVDDILQMADKMLYEAKNSGRNRVVVYQPDQRTD